MNCSITPQTTHLRTTSIQWAESELEKVQKK